MITGLRDEKLKETLREEASELDVLNHNWCVTSADGNLGEVTLEVSRDVVVPAEDSFCREKFIASTPFVR